MVAAKFLLFVVFSLVVLGLLERARHRSNLKKIPVRIHVNGTRGKSSVTRLIAAGLREAGVVACAKTTGTLARMILPDGREFPVFRPSRPNVIEQIRIVATAAAFQAEVLVIECMALQPELQWLSESKLVCATHGVITNARADHLDVMGPDETDVALALAGITPRNGTLFTADRRHTDILEASAIDRKSKFVKVTDEDISCLTSEDISRFRYTEHAENVALALAVCADLGVDRGVALRGMWQCRPDPGAMTEYSLDFHGRRIVFINGFAANDPESTERVWAMALARHPSVENRVAVFNCRSDRADRSMQLGRAYARWTPADHVVLMGTGTYLFARAAAAEGLDASRFVFAEEQRVEEIFETIVGLVGASGLVMGMGNIGGQGLDVVRYFRNREILKVGP